MIDPKELRIGNLVEWYGVPLKVTGIRDGIYTESPPRHLVENLPMCDINPIPISPEWLERFGFYRHRDSFSLSFGIYDAEFDTKNGYFYLSCNEYEDLVEHIKYVHQLQNLYFALTGEELKVKEESQSNVLPQVGNK